MRSKRSTSTEAQLERFPIRSEFVDGQRQTFHVISCCNCPNEATSSCSSGSGSIGPEMLNRRFTRLGWYVGRTAGAHICPDCNTTRQRAAPEPVEDPIPVKDKPFSSALTADLGGIPDGAIAAPPAMVKAVATALAPKRELTFSDRRIINAKLEEVYENELIGYKKDWSDFRVAEDLGVAEAWVAEVRAANFGPAAGNEAVAQLHSDLAALTRRHEDWKILGDAIADDVKALHDRLAALGS